MMLIPLVLLQATCLLAFANGANDTFKGVATLFGSGTTDYRGALWWAVVSTLAGSVCSVFFAAQLVARFTGKGLVPEEVVADPRFTLAVAVGAGFTVLLATRWGFPISTTHSLIGGLVGAGFAAPGHEVRLGMLGHAFVLPLLLSPLTALIVAACLYRVLHRVRINTGVCSESCLCLEAGAPQAMAAGMAVLEQNATFRGRVGRVTDCRESYTGYVAGVSIQQVLNAAHYLSAGTVGFARGLSDTPKIVALLMALGTLDLRAGMAAVAVAMAAGGVLKARRVADTMSRRITVLNHGQGFSANLVTALLVIGASRFGLPVSTTHVSVGAIAGIGTVSGRATYGVITGIVASWLLTLPIAAISAAAVYWAVRL